MDYTINKLAKMSGISTRTLRYYDEIGLLQPTRVASSGYRIYGDVEVDMLQQILFYKELDFSLNEIKAMLASPDFNKAQAFTEHLTTLKEKRARQDALIRNVNKSLKTLKGESTMSNQEKFEGFKQNLIKENEEKYGKEIRAKYGDDAIVASNAHIAGLTKEQYDEGERLRMELEEALKAAVETGDPASELARRACELHKKWLLIYNPKYSKEYHLGLAEMYTSDERFRAYYDKIADGCAEFLRDAIAQNIP